MSRRRLVPARRRHTRLYHFVKSRLYGHTLIHIEQSEFCPTQNLKHFSAHVVQRRTPFKLETLYASRDGSPEGIALGGQALLQRWQISQNSLTPNRFGSLIMSGISVKIFPNRRRGPYSSVISKLCRPTSPKPACTASGIARAESFIEATAR